MEREALKLALITLEGWDNHDKWVWPETALEQAKRNTKEAITAIKEALAQPAQEPVECLDCGSHNVGVPANYDSLVDSVKAQPTQEPVAYVTGMSFGRFIVEPLNRAMVLPVGMALYAGPL